MRELQPGRMLQLTQAPDFHGIVEANSEGFTFRVFLTDLIERSTLVEDPAGGG